MIQVLLGIILLPFAAIAVVFTGALGVGLIKGIYQALLK
jgi:hypothetical protein